VAERLAVLAREVGRGHHPLLQSTQGSAELPQVLGAAALHFLPPSQRRRQPATERRQGLLHLDLGLLPRRRQIRVHLQGGLSHLRQQLGQLRPHRPEALLLLVAGEQGIQIDLRGHQLFEPELRSLDLGELVLFDHQALRPQGYPRGLDAQLLVERCRLRQIGELPGACQVHRGAQNGILDRRARQHAGAHGAGVLADYGFQPTYLVLAPFEAPQGQPVARPPLDSPPLLAVQEKQWRGSRLGPDLKIESAVADLLVALAESILDSVSPLDELPNPRPLGRFDRRQHGVDHEWAALGQQANQQTTEGLAEADVRTVPSAELLEPAPEALARQALRELFQNARHARPNGAHAQRQQRRPVLSQVQVHGSRGRQEYSAGYLSEVVILGGHPEEGHRRLTGLLQPRGPQAGGDSLGERVERSPEEARLLARHHHPRGRVGQPAAQLLGEGMAVTRVRHGQRSGQFSPIHCRRRSLG
jgi:hypothetical protein